MNIGRATFTNYQHAVTDILFWLADVKILLLLDLVVAGKPTWKVDTATYWAGVWTENCAYRHLLFCTVYIRDFFYWRLC